MLRSLTVLAVGLGLAGLPAAAPAAIVTYTFEGPQFVAGQTTPLPDRAPNVGDPSFLTSFTSTPSAGGFQILVFQPNPLFSGQALVDPVIADSDLVLTFNVPVDSLTVDFATNTPLGAPGRLELTTPVGGTSVTGTNVGGGFPGGTLTFSSDTPFTTATLRAFSAAGGRVEFAIDDLTLNTAAAVPEPASLTMLGTVLVGAAARRRLRRD